MNQAELSDEQKKLVWRYVEVWRRFRRLPDGYRSFAELEDDLAKGSGMFLCGLLVEAHSSSVISADVKDPKFHIAIFGNDDSSASDMTAQELQQARRYIIQGNGEAPVRCSWAKAPVPSQSMLRRGRGIATAGPVLLIFQQPRGS
jgi:hypothetical protein